MNGLFAQSGQDFLQLCLKCPIFKVGPLVKVKYLFQSHGSYGYSQEAYLAHGLCPNFTKEGAKLLVSCSV